MTAFFLPAFSPDVSLCRGRATWAKFGDESAVVSREPQKNFRPSVTFVGVSQFLIVLIWPSSVATPWTEMMCPR